MGRLTDSLMAALGLKPSDRVELRTETGEANKHTQLHKMQTDASQINLDKPKRTQDIASQLANSITTAVIQTGGVVTKPHEQSTQVTTSSSSQDEPKKDCLSCKVISSSILFGMSGYVMLMVYRNNIPAHLKKRRQRVGYIATCVGLSTALCICGIARAFDLGLFSKDPEQELKGEIAWLYRFAGKEPPEFTKPKSNEEQSAS